MNFGGEDNVTDDASRVSQGMQIARKTVLLLLRVYKWILSPMLPPSCRYVPTCSEYAREAVERYGAVRGGWIALARVLRCHPFVKGGYDPVVRRKGAVEKFGRS